MLKLIIFRKYNLIFFLAVIIIASCDNTDSTDNSNPDSTKTHTSTAMPDSLPVETTNIKPLSGNLDILSVKARTFLSLPDEEIAFKFYLGGADTVTLHGWSNDANHHDNSDNDSTYTPPNIKLEKFRKSPYSFGPQNYFGNLILRKTRGVKKIKELINLHGATYVLFVPRNPKENGGHVTYDIRVSKDDLENLIKNNLPVKFVDITVSIKANPSPPRKGSSGTGNDPP